MCLMVCDMCNRDDVEAVRQVIRIVEELGFALVWFGTRELIEGEFKLLK